MSNKIAGWLCVLFFSFSSLFSSASAEILDQFGQTVTSEINTKIDNAKKLRLPYGKSEVQAKSDSLLAIKLLNEVLESNPNSFRALFNLGLAHHQTGDYLNAKIVFGKAAELQKSTGIKDITLLNSAGWVSLENGDFVTAEKYLLEALSNIEIGTPYTQSAIYSNLGQLYFFVHRFDDAKRYLTIARDKYGSEAAASKLLLIETTLRIIRSKK